MRKFQIPSQKSKKAFPKAMYKGSTVRVRGVERLDEQNHVYYQVQPVTKRKGYVESVRSDKLIAI